ncbi:hypothetical protein AXX17_AT5G01950 [Arabidopsis thaliana]|uniref:Uncharacterized protein n=1 Tax=Arabidopsis thaliana TaxID=3702 RepID=A0A178UFH1_ARATH|nr:hypothetical protein AXX17_AT5G01950 [Arabidopsis thaliana]
MLLLIHRLSSTEPQGCTQATFAHLLNEFGSLETSRVCKKRLNLFLWILGIGLLGTRRKYIQRTRCQRLSTMEKSLGRVWI